jgi:hypothetical protein
MLSEGRKRDAAANAVLALSFAANAAQSPQSLVRSGHDAAPSLPLMGELMRKRKEANRNLDSARVSEPARNRKKKTFKEFVEESYLIEAKTTHRDTIGHKEYDAWRDEVASHHSQHGHVRGVSKRKFGDTEYEMRNKAGKGKPKVWAASKVSDRKSSAKKRRENLKPISDDEFLSYANRNLEPNAKEVAAAAADFERQGKRKKRERARTETKKTGEPHDVDHMNPQPTRRRPENQPRFQRVSPGDSNANQSVLKRSKNTGKQDRPPKKGEPGYGLTRAGAVSASIKGGKKLLSDIDDALKA